MKPKNFPARKLRRKIVAGSESERIRRDPYTALESARAIRTKKNRSAGR